MDFPAHDIVSNAVSYAKAKGIDVSSEEKVMENARKVGIHNIAYTTKELGSIKSSLREIWGLTLIALLAAIPLVLRRKIRI